MRALSALLTVLTAASTAGACSDEVASTGRALPAHYYFDSEPRERQWPAVIDPQGEPTETAPVPTSALEPTAVTAAFRRAWFADVVGNISDPVLRDLADTLAPCMRTDEQYALQMMSRRDAYRQVHRLTTQLDGAFCSGLVAGDLSRLRGSGRVWAVTFLGGSRKLPPSGVFAGYIDPETGELLVAVHWPEG